MLENLQIHVIPWSPRTPHLHEVSYQPTQKFSTSNPWEGVLNIYTVHVSKLSSEYLGDHFPLFTDNYINVIILNILILECNIDHPCEGLGRHATFRNFGMAFLTLFRVSTGDNWNGIMKVSFFQLSNTTLGNGQKDNGNYVFLHRTLRFCLSAAEVSNKQHISNLTTQIKKNRL